jgi:stage V sporulation protein G
MEITDVQIKLADPPEKRVLAYASVTFDHCFLVRDIRIIRGTSGIFIAMPARKITSHCPRCHGRTCLADVHCANCGQRLPKIPIDGPNRPKLYNDVAHPITRQCRNDLHNAILQRYHQTELESQSRIAPAHTAGDAVAEIPAEEPDL